MCGRYTSTSTAEQLAEIYQVDEVRTESLALRWNVAPSLPVYAVVDRRRPAAAGPDTVPGGSDTDTVPGGSVFRQLGTFRWGLVPSWAKDPSVGNRMINARADSIQQRPAFRSAFARRRCLVPADAFYEWQVPPVAGVPGGPASKRSKVPWAVRRRDGQPMAFAGLWEVWKDRGGEGALLRTCTIITTEANDLLAPIHHRMPVVLPAADWDRWLDPDNEDLDALGTLLKPAPDEWFDAFIVSSRVNTVTNEGCELLDPAPPPEPWGGDIDVRGGASPADSKRHVQAPLFDVAGVSDL
jgi:putative SOS response-associated peptidase YedK